jgi:hypothetical protein
MTWASEPMAWNREAPRDDRWAVSMATMFGAAPQRKLRAGLVNAPTSMRARRPR